MLFYSSSVFHSIAEDSAKSLPFKSCKEIKTNLSNSNSGVYWIKLNISDGSSKASITLTLPVYCDMETYGGGWTLVYSYTFTNYDDFFDASNAVTPCPSWPAVDKNVETSTVAPQNESRLGALAYDLWQYIGEEFLIKSNINDWIVCQPGSGSLVQEIDGDISCVNIKNVAETCAGVEPTDIAWRDCGPRIYASTSFYRFDGSTDYCYPTHDPCNSGDTDNQKRNVINPGGNIFLR